MDDISLEGTIAEFGKSFLDSIIKSDYRSDFENDSNLYHLIVETPEENRIKLKLSGAIIEHFSTYLTIAEELYHSIQNIKDQMEPILSDVDEENIDLALDMSETIKKYNIYFYGVEGFNVYQNLGTLNYTLEEVKDAIDFGKRLVMDDTYHLTLSSELLEDLCKIEDVAYNFFKTKDILEEQQLIAISLISTHSLLPRALAITKDPSLYDKIKHEVDPDLGIVETDDELENIRKYFDITTRNIDNIYMRIRTNLPESDGLLQHMKAYSSKSQVSIELAGKYKGEEFVISLNDSDPRKRSQIYTYFSEDARFGSITLEKSKFVIEYAGRIRDYLDAQLNRLTQVNTTGEIVNIGNLADGKDAIQRTIHLLNKPEDDSAEGILYDVVRDPQEQFGLNPEFKITFRDVPVQALPVVSSDSIIELRCNYKNIRSDGRLIKAIGALYLAEERHKEKIRSKYSDALEEQYASEIARIKYDVLRSEY